VVVDNVVVKSFASSGAREIAVVSFVGMLMGAAVVVGYIAAQPSPCCGDKKPYASIFQEPLSRLDVVLGSGDGQSFDVLAQDPLLQRPSVIADQADFAYRAQRPMWGYLAWIGSAGQRQLAGGVLAVMTVLSCAGACAVAAMLLVQRGRSPWWALVIPVAGFETLTELTPEFLALSFVAVGILLWQRDRRVAAVVAFTAATLTRETMLIAIAALMCWELVHHLGPIRTRVLRITPLVAPLGAYLVWIGILRLRLGNWPFNRSQDRLSLPGSGLLAGLQEPHYRAAILIWVALGVGLCAASIAYARHDVLAWIAIAFGLFGSLLGSDVWVTDAGYQRTLVPLYAFAAIAIVGSVKSVKIARRTPTHADHHTKMRSEPHTATSTPPILPERPEPRRPDRRSPAEVT